MSTTIVNTIQTCPHICRRQQIKIAQARSCVQILSGENENGLVSYKDQDQTHYEVDT